MNADMLMFIAGMVLSLSFSYIPKLESWYKSLDSTAMRLVMLLLLLIVAVGYFALSCSGLVEGAVSCTKAGGWTMLKLFFEALIANQVVYLVSPQLSPLSSRKKA